MADNNYRELMNAKGIIPITKEWNAPIAKGTLIGFTGLGKEEGITAAYPVWRVLGNEIQFVLCFSETGRPTIDNTWFGSRELHINKEPIVVDIEVKNPISFAENLSSFFTGKKHI